VIRRKKPVEENNALHAGMSVRRPVTSLVASAGLEGFSCGAIGRSFSIKTNARSELFHFEINALADLTLVARA
jgi:hypothetical protein